jgi:hypothetical protein
MWRINGDIDLTLFFSEDDKHQQAKRLPPAGSFEPFPQLRRGKIMEIGTGKSYPDAPCMVYCMVYLPTCFGDYWGN